MTKNDFVLRNSSLLLMICSSKLLAFFSKLMMWPIHISSHGEAFTTCTSFFGTVLSLSCVSLHTWWYHSRVSPPDSPALSPFPTIYSLGSTVHLSFPHHLARAIISCLHLSESLPSEHCTDPLPHLWGPGGINISSWYSQGQQVLWCVSTYLVFSSLATLCWSTHVACWLPLTHMSS